MKINTHNYEPYEGKFVNLRESEIEDSSFILSLRTDAKKSRYLHKTQNSLDDQIKYMQRYKTLRDEWYFIVVSKKQKRLGTISIYPNEILLPHWINQNNIDSDNLKAIGAGRWIMSDEASYLEVLESVCLVKKILFLDFLVDFEPFTVHKDNLKVLQFHKRWGANIVGNSGDLQLLELSRNDYLKNKDKFENMLKEG